MQPANATSVFIVDDSDSIRQRLIAMIGTIPNVVVVGEAATAPDAISGIVQTCPDVVLLDLNLGGTSGMSVLKTIQRKLPSVSVVVLTNHAEPQYRRACMNAGARHFFDKSTQFDCVRGVISECEVKSTGRQP